MTMRNLKQTPAIVRSSLLTEYDRLARSLGLDSIALMRRAGIDRLYLENPDATMPMRDFVELLEITTKSSGIHDFGLRLAEMRGLPDLGPVTLMLREQATVRDALKTLIGFFHLHSNALNFHLQDSDQPIVTIDLIVVDADQCRQAIETSVASLTNILRWLLGESWSPAAACFTHARPPSKAPHDRFFRCPVDFLQEFNGVILHRHDLDRALPAYSPAMRRQVERYIRSIDVASSDTYVHRVTQIITMALHRGEAKADVIARYLGTNRRTLNRRLARAQLNYSALLETVRKTLAVQHLSGSERPVSDIAGLVGFASLSSFGIWFRRAFHLSPSAWRKRQMKAGRSKR
jgi:AraC-like DNA-binding protein